MGYRTIQEHRKQLDEKIKVFRSLVEAAKSLSEQWAKVYAAQQRLTAETDKVEEVAAKIAAQMGKLDTKGIKEFESYRQSLIAIGSRKASYMQPLPTKPLDDVVRRMSAQIEAEHRAWIEKRAKQLPAELKPGMVLFDKTQGVTFEIKAGPNRDPRLSGDVGITYKAVQHANGRAQDWDLTLALIKRNGMRLVQT